MAFELWQIDQRGVEINGGMPEIAVLRGFAQAHVEGRLTIRKLTSGAHPLGFDGLRQVVITDGDHATLTCRVSGKGQVHTTPMPRIDTSQEPSPVNGQDDVLLITGQGDTNSGNYAVTVHGLFRHIASTPHLTEALRNIRKQRKA